MNVTITIADDIVPALQARLRHPDRQIVAPDDLVTEPVAAWLTAIVTAEVIATRKADVQARLAAEEAKGAASDDTTVADLLLEERRLTVAKS